MTKIRGISKAVKKLDSFFGIRDDGIFHDPMVEAWHEVKTELVRLWKENVRFKAYQAGASIGKQDAANAEIWREIFNDPT